MKPQIAMPTLISASNNKINSEEIKFNYRVYYEDTDAGGVVYYANYLKFFERARTDFLRTKGISQSQLAEKEGLVFVVRRCEIDYISPARLDDFLEVSVEIKNISAASISIFQKIINTSSSLNLCSLVVEIVCVDLQNFKPKKIPQILKNDLLTKLTTV